MAAPRSLGEPEAVAYTTRIETVRLPATRELIVKEVESQLGRGKVQRLILQVGKPIIIERLVPKTADAVVEPLPDLEAEDVYGAMRNGTVIDFTAADDWTMHQIFFHAFRAALAGDFKSVGILVKNTPLFVRRLGLADGSAIPEVFGMPVYVHNEIPDDVIVLVFSKDEDGEFTHHSYRVLL